VRRILFVAQPDPVSAGLDRDHLRAVGFDDRKIDEALASVKRCFDDESCLFSVSRKEKP
jgi:hypothetical protein